MKKISSTRVSGTIFFWNLAQRNFVFYLRSNLFFAAGCALCAMILIGALGIGTSLRESIRRLYKPRLGDVIWVLNASSGHFRASLADSINTYLPIKTAPIILQTGSVGIIGENERAHRVNIVGVDNRFWEFRGRYGNGHISDNVGDNFAVVNSALAEKLGIDSGNQIIMRFQTAGSLAMDAPFGLQENTATLRLPVTAIVGRDQFGDFSLKAEHFTVYNVFVPLQLLQSVNDIPEMASAILIGESSDKSLSVTQEQIIDVVQKSLNIKDAGLNMRIIDNIGGVDIEIYSDRIFMSEPIKNIITAAIPKAIPITAWFVNSINTSELLTPYSFVSTAPIKYHLEDNQVALSGWTADDLNVSIGDTVMMTYFVPQVTSGLRLDSAVFVVSAINQDTASWFNRSLMPPYPGLAGAHSCTDWNPSIPVNLDKIRPKDEEYWEKYGGMPKAIIGYAAATRIWGNRFGVCTAMRIPYGNNQYQRQEANDTVNRAYNDINMAIFPLLSPALCGMQLTDIRAVIDSAVNNGIDFAPLFAGLSFFTLAAALLLVWLLSTLQVKSRMGEHRILAAMGYSRQHILLIYLSEGVITFSVGIIAGALLAPLYIFAIIKALQTVWHAAAQVPELNLHINISTIIYGSAAAFVCALIVMLIPILSSTKNLRRAPLTPYALIKRTSTQIFNKRRFILLNILCENKRVIGEILILACALFVLGTVQLFHHRIFSDPTLSSSGTGGFMWYGELNSGIPYEETTAQFLRERGVDINDVDFLSVGMRMKDGDDASCLNLNKATSPAILGVNQMLFDSIDAFSFSSMINVADKNHPWRILAMSTDSQKTNYIYGIADANTIEWGLGKSLGDTLIYINEYGDTLNIILAAGLNNSILQGKIIIAESDFLRHYPSISGYRLLLLSTPHDKKNTIANAFQAYHDKSGLQLESTVERLNTFNAVENTYLSIFALLGMMGLVIGCAGMGIVVARNIEERRGEIALLMVQGFTTAAIKRMLFLEHAIIAAIGTLAGVILALFVSLAYTGVVSISSIFRIAGLIAIVFLCGAGAIVVGLRKLKKWDLVRTFREEV